MLQGSILGCHCSNPGVLQSSVRQRRHIEMLFIPARTYP